MDKYLQALEKVTNIFKKTEKFDKYFDQLMKFYEYFSSSKAKDFKSV